MGSMWQSIGVMMGLFFVVPVQAQPLLERAPLQTAQLPADCVTVDCRALSKSSRPVQIARNYQAATTQNQFNRSSAEFDSQPNCIIVTGTASSDGVDEAFARQMAIRNGLNFASINNNVVVSSDQTVQNYELTRDSTRFTSSSKVESYKVLEEGFEEAFDTYGEEIKRPLNYQVKMEVCLTENPQVCENLSGNNYQPRLVIAPLAVAQNYAVGDISNLVPGYQSELNRRLIGSAYQNLTLLNRAIAIDPQVGIYPNTDSEQLGPIRDQTGAQYMLMTVLRSASAHIQPDNLSSKVLNPIKHFYNLPVENDARFIEIDWYLVDLIERKVIHQQRQGFDIKGDVRVGRDRPFGSNAFFATDTGMVFHSLLTAQVRSVVKALQCKELNTQIIDVRGDEYVLYLNADSGAKVGDQLAVYQRLGRSVQFQGIDLGDDETPNAFIKIKRILPRFAVAELVANKGTVQVGDTVKAW